MTVYRKNHIRRTPLGPLAQKVLLLLEAGISLGLTRRPDKYFKVVRQTIKAWKKIDEQNLRRVIKRLYQSKLIASKTNQDGTESLILSDDGKRRVLRYRFDKMQIPKPAKWDKLWRIVIFDIPEDQKAGRDALARKLKILGFYPIQKSVFIFPYECKNEIEYVAEMFNVKPFVRFMTVKDIDIESDLKRKFGVK